LSKQRLVQPRGVVIERAVTFRALEKYPDGRVKPADAGYFVPGVALPQWKVPMPMKPRNSGNFLFDRAADPGQESNL